MFRGSIEAKTDDKGRVKLPPRYIDTIASNGGGRVFITSIKRDCVRLYPLDTWIEFEQELRQSPSSKRIIRKFLRIANRFGHETALDAQGRVLIPRDLRDLLKLNGQVLVVGNNEFLEVWNKERFDKDLGVEEWTEADEDEMSELGH